MMGDKNMITLNEMIEKCEENLWLRSGALEDAIAELDYQFNLIHCDSIEQFIQYMKQGNWSIRQGFALQNLLFVNQINAGDEWWTIRKKKDGNLIAFESISFQSMIESIGEGAVAVYIKFLLDDRDPFVVIKEAL